MDKEQMLEMLRDATVEPYQLGLTFRAPMIAPVVERCISRPAGPLRFVVEARHLDDRVISEHMGAERHPHDALFDDFGPTLHVHGADDGIEHLRFDCFRHKPHYHYVFESGAVNTVCRIDQFAEGDAVEWTIGRLRERLPEMLEHCGVEALAEQVRARRIEVLNAVEDVASLLRQAELRATVERSTV
jgi:hypothetical protein